MLKYLFIDRDGTLIDEPGDGKIDSPEKMIILPGVVSSLKMLQIRGYRLIMVSNQPGLGTESFPQATFDIPQQMLMEELRHNGVEFAEVHFCPHRKEDNCTCRKPKTGMIAHLLGEDFDKEHSYTIGDRESDIGLAKNAGCKSITYSAEPKPGADFSAKDWHAITNYITSHE